MKILLDENLPHRLRHEIVGHDVSTIAYLGWTGVENGELLRRLKKGDILLFVDAVGEIR